MEGGLPIPVATPAHGTAFDIAGKNLAAISSTQNSFNIAVTMAERRILKAANGIEDDAVPATADLSKSTAVVVPSCC